MYFMRARLEKFYRVSKGIIEDDLRSSDAGNDFVPELQPDLSELCDFFCKIGNWYLNAIPSARTRFPAVRHWTSPRTLRAAEKQTQRTACNCGEGGQSL